MDKLNEDIRNNLEHINVIFSNYENCLLSTSIAEQVFENIEDVIIKWSED